MIFWVTALLKLRWYNALIVPPLYILCFAMTVFGATHCLVLTLIFILNTSFYKKRPNNLSPVFKKNISKLRVFALFVYLHCWFLHWTRFLKIRYPFGCLLNGGGRTTTALSWALEYFVVSVTVEAHLRAIRSLRALYGYQASPYVSLSAAWYNYAMTEWCFASCETAWPFDYAEENFLFDTLPDDGAHWTDRDAFRELPWRDLNRDWWNDDDAFSNRKSDPLGGIEVGGRDRWI